MGWHYEVERPFSAEDFKASEVGQAAARAIEEHKDEIVRNADLGLTPLAVVIPDLEGLINERLQWRMVDWMIRDWLAPNFEESGRMWVPTDEPHKGFCYTRISSTP